LSWLFYFFFGLIGLLLLLFAWALRTPHRRGRTLPDVNILEGPGCGSVAHLPQIRQAFAEADFGFLSQRVPDAVVRRVRRERRRVAWAYLSDVKEDFQCLLRTAKIISLLSPELAAVQEFERVRLTIKFNLRYRLLQFQLHAGLAPIPRLHGLSELVSGLSVRMETAMKELGERAALATEMASSLDGRGSDIA
jgi:hypothetical protein